MGSDYLIIIEEPDGEIVVRGAGAMRDVAERLFEEARREGPHVRLVRVVSEQFNPRTPR